MARLFVFNDNLTARVEVITDPDSQNAAYCAGCTTGGSAAADNLLHEMPEQWEFDAALRAASEHADQCKRCADSDCRTEGRHDAGHRCRKN